MLLTTQKYAKNKKRPITKFRIWNQTTDRCTNTNKAKQSQATNTHKSTHLIHFISRRAQFPMNTGVVPLEGQTVGADVSVQIGIKREVSRQQ